MFRSLLSQRRKGGKTQVEPGVKGQMAGLNCPVCRTRLLILVEKPGLELSRLHFRD
jgi:hypothetical protein